MTAIEQWPLHTLQQRLLAVLQRLSDLDTRSASYQTLLSFIQRIEPESVPILIECLCQNNTHQKPAARALIVQLIGCLAATIKSSLGVYVPRLIQFLTKSLQDVDCRVQEAGGISLGQICRFTLQPDLLQSVLSTLYRLMASKPTPIQASVALALAHLLSVLEPDILAAFYETISMVTMRHLCKPSIHPVVRRHLFNALAAIPPSKVSPSAVPNLFRVLTSNLTSVPWQVSLSAAGALASWADPCFHNVYGAAVIAALQEARFHRIAQVREAVVTALNRWKSLSNPLPLSVVMNSDLTPGLPSNESDWGKSQAEYLDQPAEIKPTPFEFAPEPPAPSKSKQQNFQQKILRQQRLLFDLVEDLCRRVDMGMVNIRARLSSLESISEYLQQQNYQRSYSEQPSSAFNDKIWPQVVNLLEQSNIAGAIQVCCESGDDICLVRLLGRLSLECKIAADMWALLMARFSQLLTRCAFVDSITPWIMKALRENIHISAAVYESAKQAKLHPNASPSVLSLCKRLGIS